MADTKISGMTSLTQTDVVTTTDVIPIVDIGPPNANKKITPQALVGAAINNLVQTWNDAPTTFTGFKFNITDTASAASSLFMDLQVGGSSRFSVRKDGVLSTAAKANFASVTITLGETGTGEVTVRSTGGFGWSPDATALSTPDTILRRDAADTLAQRRSTNAQTFRVYNTFTDASNFERGRVAWESSTFVLGAQAAGTGTNRTTYLTSSGNTSAAQVRIGTDASGGRIWFTPANQSAWEMTSNGHFLAGVDNVYDIGASGASRPRNLYLAGTITSSAITSTASITAGPGSYLKAGNGNIQIAGPSDGVMGIYNSNANDFNRLQFGGTTSAFPALKRNSNTLEVKLADDSGAAPLTALSLSATSYVRAGYLDFVSGAHIYAPSTGVITLYNIAETDFNRLQFGGTTSSFPALKRSGAELQARLADDSALTGLQASTVIASTYLAITNGNTSIRQVPLNDALLFQNNSNFMEQRNGVNAQTFRIYNTYTDASNYERGELRWNANNLELIAAQAGTGATRSLRFGINNSAQWAINTSGHFVTVADNAYDIGASGATRPRNLYLGGGIFANAAFVLTGNPGGGGATSRYISGAGTTTDWYFNVPTGGTYYFATAEVQRWRIENTGHFFAATDNTYDIGAVGASRPRDLFLGGSLTAGSNITLASAGTVSFSSRTRITSPNDGFVLLQNNAATDFSRLQFGGTSSAFPALKRSGAALHLRLADDSTFANLECGAVTALDVLRSEARLHAHYATAIPAGGTTGAGVRVSSTANFGMFFGSGAPTLSAAKGSIYLRSDGTTTNDRMYVNTDGATTWTAVTTAA